MSEENYYTWESSKILDGARNGEQVAEVVLLRGYRGENALGHDMTASSNYSNAVAAATKISVPVTFVLGSEDKMTPIRGATELIDAASDASVIRLESTGHFMATEDPIGVRDAIAQGIGWDGTR